MTESLEQDLQAREACLRALTELLTEHGVVVHDSRGRPILANTAARRILGRPPVLGADLDEHAAALGLESSDGAPLSVDDNPITTALRGVETRDRMLAVRKAEGLATAVLASAWPVRGADDRIEGAVLLLRDLAEIERAAAFREAFLARAGHELRTPLAALLTATQVLERRARKKNEPPDRALQIVVESVQNLRKLVEDVLDLSRIGRGRLELRKQNVPLGPILRAGAEDACRARGADSVAVAEGDVIAGEWDPDRVRQVVRNLVDNALVHGSAPVRVVVDEATADRVRFSIRDKGKGVAPERRGEVLQPFVRTERDVSVGHGLGLALASEITRAHGGKLWVGDDDGAGCAVFVELPLA